MDISRGRGSAIEQLHNLYALGLEKISAGIDDNSPELILADATNRILKNKELIGIVVYDIGGQLIRIKEALHSQGSIFYTWIEETLKISPSTARRFMLIHKTFSPNAEILRSGINFSLLERFARLPEEIPGGVLEGVEDTIPREALLDLTVIAENGDEKRIRDLSVEEFEDLVYRNIRNNLQQVKDGITVQAIEKQTEERPSDFSIGEIELNKDVIPIYDVSDSVPSYTDFTPARVIHLLLSHYTKVDDRVLDPFAGSGSILLGRRMMREVTAFDLYSYQNFEDVEEANIFDLELKSKGYDLVFAHIPQPMRRSYSDLFGYDSQDDLSMYKYKDRYIDRLKIVLSKLKKWSLGYVILMYHPQLDYNEYGGNIVLDMPVIVGSIASALDLIKERQFIVADLTERGDNIARAQERNNVNYIVNSFHYVDVFERRGR